MHLTTFARTLKVLLGVWAMAIGVVAVERLSAADAPLAAAEAPLVLVVMDPLAKELSCPCVKGYAQRDYQRLAEFLSARLGRQVEVVFAESLAKAAQASADGRIDLVIGKQSVVLHDAEKMSRAFVRTALLTGKDGAATQTGLIVVAADDPARDASDLKQHRLLFGPPECEEKFAAAIALLRKHGVAVPAAPETVAGCEEGAAKILEPSDGRRAAAVISSYAKPLLEGCGTVPKGALRVVGETSPVPFVATFVAADLPEKLRTQITASFAATAAEPLLCFALESKRGFTIVADVGADVATPESAETASEDVKKK